MGGISVVRRGTRRVVDIDVRGALRRLFGQSVGVNVGVVFIALVVGLLLIRPLVVSGLSLHRTAALLTERRAEVAQLEHTHERLQERVDYYRTDTFIAEQARAYGMVEPGEQTYVIRELVHPESAAEYAIARLRNATVDSNVSLSRTG